MQRYWEQYHEDDDEALAGWLAATLVPTAALADTFTVTTTADTCSSTPPLCTPGTLAGTWNCAELRSAFETINASTVVGASHVIQLPAGTITFHNPTTPWVLENDNECGDMDLTFPVDLTIIGTPGSSVLDANGGNTDDRALDFHAGSVTLVGFSVKNGNAQIGFTGIDPAAPNYGGGGVRSFVPLTLEGMTLSLNALSCTGPFAHGGGGALFVQGAATVRDSLISENSAQECAGGGLHVTGALTMSDSHVRQNLSDQGGIGGGIALDGGGASVITRSSVSVNTTSRSGGGVWVFGGGTSLELRDSAVHDNVVNWFAPTCATCPTGGGGISILDTASVLVHNSTISTNAVAPTVGGSSPTPVGGGIWVASPGATLDLEYATVADHIMPSPTMSTGLQCDGVCTVEDTIIEDRCAGLGSLAWGGTSVDSGGGTCGTGPSIVPAFLGPLGFYGASPTETHDHPVGSPADNAANPATCPAADQRGVTRSPTCDVGAHEVP